MKEDLNKMMKDAKGVLDHHAVPVVVLDASGECYLPKDIMLASGGFTGHVYVFNGTDLRKLEARDAMRLPVTPDGKALVGEGMKVASCKDAKAETKTPPASKDAKDGTPPTQ